MSDYDVSVSSDSDPDHAASSSSDDESHSIPPSPQSSPFKRRKTHEVTVDHSRLPSFEPMLDVSSASSHGTDISDTTGRSSCESDIISGGAFSEEECNSDLDTDCSVEGSLDCNTYTDECSPLYGGCSMSTDEAVLRLMDLYVQNRWSKTSLKATLRTFLDFMPECNTMPTSVYKLFKYVESKTVEDYSEIKHYYCSDCKELKPSTEDNCIKCNSESFGIFYELPLAIQIKHFFENCDLADAIDSYRLQLNTCRDDIADISDGLEYRKLKDSLTGPYDLTLLWNTDGVSLSRSSQTNLWPLLGVLCEVPPHLRTKYMVVCGVWCDSIKPKVNSFLKPFVGSLKTLSEERILWQHPTSKDEQKTVLIAPILCADAPARADVLVQHHNAKYGCNMCEQKAVKIDQVPDVTKPLPKKLRRLVFSEEPARLRTGERMDRQGHLAEVRGIPKKGVVGTAVISNIPYLDRAMCVIPEYMHSVLLGVVYQLLTLWVSVKGPWYIGKKVKEIDDFLSTIKVPDYVCRRPRGISVLKHWKASEIRSWLLFYSLPALTGHLPEKYLQHFMLLMSAIYILLKDKISEANLKTADTLIRMFVRDIGSLYRLQDYVYNVHCLLHLPLCVKRWGPLWATSAFIFENYNGVLSAFIHGKRNKGIELVKKIKIAQGVEVLRNSVQRNKCHKGVTNVMKQGKSSNVKLNPEEEIALADAGLTEFELGSRMQFNSQIFTTKSYDVKKKRGNSFVSINLDKQPAEWGQIIHLIKTVQNEFFALVKQYKVQHTRIFCHTQTRHSLRHLVSVDESESCLRVINLNHVEKVIKVGIYFCVRPNAIEKNL